MTAPPPFWRFLPKGEPADAASLQAAAKLGQGAFARALREARASAGTHRTAALLRPVEPGTAPAFRLLVASAFQPRAVEDALRVAFAIAGLRIELRLIDGHAAFATLLAEPESSLLAEADMVLLPLLPEAGGSADVVADLARRAAEHCRAPVLVVSPGGEPMTIEGAAEHIAVPVVGPAVDERFAATFGAIPTPEAADRIADRVAARAARLRGLAPKLLVTDLDGTLWSGTLGEGGPGELHRAYAGVLAALASRGIVLAIASRNESADVEAAFAANPDWPLRFDRFAAGAVGWDGKDELVAKVLESLSLGSQHLVFVDDDAANCARVAARFPAADVRHFGTDAEAFAAMLADDPLLQEAGSEAGDRRELYRRREAVERLRAETPDVGAFLHRLDTRLTAVPLVPALLPRAAELAARVNQFAMNGVRPTVADLAARASPLDFMVRLDDAFGAHGLVGLVLAHAEGGAATVDGFFLSCRALGRGVEAAILRGLAERAAESGCWRLMGRIEHLPRNEPARRCFSAYAVAGSDIWTVRLGANEPPKPEGVTLRWDRTT